MNGIKSIKPDCEPLEGRTIVHDGNLTQPKVNLSSEMQTTENDSAYQNDKPVSLFETIVIEKLGDCRNEDPQGAKEKGHLPNSTFQKET